MCITAANSRKIMSIRWIFVVVCLPICHSLECYVCDSQDSNNEKCTATIKTCDPSETRCLTEVRWGSTPYWAPSGEKQHYISKWCASDKNCSDQIAAYRHRCDRIWYNDWECAECCTGDRCNYYVTLGSSSTGPLIWLCLAAPLLAMMKLT